MNIHRYFKTLAYTICIVSLLFCSCKKSDRQQIVIGEKIGKEPLGILEYYNFLSKPTDGFFGIKTYTTKVMQKELRQTQIEGYFHTKDNRAIQGGDIFLGDIKLTSDPTKNFLYSYSSTGKKSIFSGQKIKLKFSPPGNTRVQQLGGEMYVPQDIYLDDPGGGSAGGAGTPPDNSEQLFSGKHLIWNADINNLNGVIIILEYDPTNLANLFLQSNHPNLFRKAITVTDNGEYIFTSGDLLDLPVGARITVTAGRANFTEIVDANNQKSYSVYAYTITEGFFILQ